MSRKGREGRRARKRNNSGGENQAFVQSERAAIQKRILRFHATSPFCQGRVDCMFGMGMGPNREAEATRIPRKEMGRNWRDNQGLVW